jgi:hypothetical protein
MAHLSDWASPYTQESSLKKTDARKKVSPTMLTSMTDEDPLSDFKPKVQPIQPPVQQPIQQPVRRPTFETMAKAYDEPMVYTPNDPVMVEKLNRLIQLLEDQRDEKTGYVTEEIILYMFLGIFVIFVLDSFVKTGKYSR